MIQTNWTNMKTIDASSSHTQPCQILSMISKQQVCDDVEERNDRYEKNNERERFKERISPYKNLKN